MTVALLSGAMKEIHASELPSEHLAEAFAGLPLSCASAAPPSLTAASALGHSECSCPTPPPCQCALATHRPCRVSIVATSGQGRCTVLCPPSMCLQGRNIMVPCRWNQDTAGVSGECDALIGQAMFTAHLRAAVVMFRRNHPIQSLAIHSFGDDVGLPYSPRPAAITLHFVHPAQQRSDRNRIVGSAKSAHEKPALFPPSSLTLFPESLIFPANKPRRALLKTSRAAWAAPDILQAP